MSDRNRKFQEAALTDFTDSLLDGKNTPSGDPSTIDPELLGWQATIQRVWNALPSKDPAPDMKIRIRNRMMNEYHHTVVQQKGVRETVFKRRLLGFGLAAAVVAAIGAIVIWLPASGGATTGSAGSIPAWVPALVILFAFTALGLWWLLRKK